jgi:aspartate aminotransferase-like enzyme
VPNLPAIQERFDALAAEALEALMEDVEEKNRVVVTALDVELVPNPDHHSSPTVAVAVTVEQVKRWDGTGRDRQWPNVR